MSHFKLSHVLSAAVLAMSTLAAPAFAHGGHHGTHHGHGHHVRHHLRHHPHHAHTSARFNQPNEAALLEHGHYRNRDGVSVHAPAHSVSGAAPAGASARCGDGSYSFSLHHRGTCSHHGGVASWL